MAASALAAVGAAILASSLGVAGTIIGAAVVSIGATCGSAVFQHVFRRTGEEIRSRVPAVVEAAQTPEEWAAARRADAVVAFDKDGAAATAQFDPFDPGGEHTRMMAQVAPPAENESVTVYKGGKPARKRTWKFYALVSGLVFVLAMTPIAITEFATGQTVGTTVWGGTGGSGSSDGVGGSPSQTPGQGGSAAATPSGGSTGTGSGTDPSATPSSSAAASTPTPSASASASTAPSASASASSTPSTAASGTADPAAGAGATASSTATP
ncbi:MULTISPECIES: hypothetical protein [Streptacidiphilus]|uniref:Uncharacterized protein n=1 Tax=Streptacidiphilus cavernicola TaxID=3342716 RepID=A0ABV6ULM3_9ACTN|nr:hypothetical protein [Streptacidiphilus jeojiense]